MNTQCLSLDIISTLPEDIIENILTLMPIRDALRTSVLSKKWQYKWQSMPKLEFTKHMVKASPDCKQLKKYKLVSAIFHVLLLHNGPIILKLYPLDLDSEFAQITSYLARRNTVKELILSHYNFRKLPVSLFSLQGLEHIDLICCTFEPPLKFNGFSRLRSMTFTHVKVSAQVLRQFLSKCPLLELICLYGHLEDTDFVAQGNKFTFVELLQCVPLISSLELSYDYTKYLSAGGMPHQLPTPLVHLKHLILGVHTSEHNTISSALCVIRSSPSLVKIKFKMFGYEKSPQTPDNFLDPKHNSDLKLDHLEILEIKTLGNLPLGMDFMKLIMAKSPVLKKVRIDFYDKISVDEELKMLRDLLLLPFPRASPSAKLIINRVKSFV